VTRKLKTYVTSAGFFDLAVAAPSMKAALEAWGSKSNLFQHGFARQSEDARIVAATMARPGIVLRRPVGSTGAFSEHAELPRNLPVIKAGKAAEKKPPRETAPERVAPERVAPEPEAVDDKAAARAYEKEQQRRDSARRKEEAAREKDRQRRDKAIAAAESALAEAQRNHDARAAEIDKERAALDRRAEAEESRWRKKKEELESVLRKTRSVGYLRAM
jgi:hypothetical protein